MSNPQISIIIPVYNAEKYISQMIECILEQTFQDYELILIDDGSTDRSAAIIQRFQKDYPEKVSCYYQSNQGQSVARNHGYDYAEGKYIAFLDADDLIFPTYFQDLYETAEKNNAQIAYCSYQAFDDSTGKILYNRMTENWNVSFDATHSHIFQYSPCCRLVRKDYIDQYGFRFGAGEQMEDGPYCMMVDLLADRKAIINKIEYRYRIWGESTTGKIGRKNSTPKVPYNCLLVAINTVKSNTNDLVKLKMLEYCSIKIMAGWVTNIFVNAGLDVRKEICDYCKNTMDVHFADAQRNEYISVLQLGKLPLTHKLAVELFVFAYKADALLTYSKLSSFVLRLIE